MKKSFCILCFALCCVFVGSCRTVESEKDQPYWDLYGWPEPYPDFVVDWGAYEQRTALMEMRITKLESAVGRLDRENEILTTELEEQIGWSKFWKRLTKILMKGLYHVEEENQKIEEVKESYQGNESQSQSNKEERCRAEQVWHDVKIQGRQD